ncbi:ThiF family adenylyltransferase, partial [Lonsdalea populi]
LFDDSAPTCVESGVMAPLVGIMGSLQAMETLKLLTHFGAVNAGKLLMVDAMTVQFRELALPKDPACEVCGSQLSSSPADS